MHGVLEGHSSHVKFYVPPEKGGGGGWGGGWHHEMYLFHIIDTIHNFITISMRFFQQVSFNNSNPFSVLWSLWVQLESYEYILNFVPSFWATYKRTRNLILYHHFELPRREPETIFDSMIGWYLQKRKKNYFQLSTRPHVFFGTGLVTSTENPKS